MENDVGVIRIPKHPRWSPSPVDLSVSNTLNSPPPAPPSNSSNSSSHPLAAPHTLGGLGSPLNLSALTPHQLSALGTLNSQLNLGNLPGLTLNSLSTLTANAPSTGNYRVSFYFCFILFWLSSVLERSSCSTARIAESSCEIQTFECPKIYNCQIKPSGRSELLVSLIAETIPEELGMVGKRLKVFAAAD